MKFERIRFSFLLLIVECGILVTFLVFVRYDVEVKGPLTRHRQHKNNFETEQRASSKPHKNIISRYDPLYQDVQLMIFVGFGLQMSFLGKYGYSAIGLMMIIGVLGTQWSILCYGLLHLSDSGLILIDITTILNAIFGAASVLITLGTVLGVTTPWQLIVCGLIEIPLYFINDYIGTFVFQALDTGGSVPVHLFGAYFGLALSRAFKPSDEIVMTNKFVTKTSDMLSLAGTAILWVYWPSFIGAMSTGVDLHRIVVNTFLSLSGSLVFTFISSALIGRDNKLSVMHVQCSTLAGGVAIGAVSDLLVQPFGAMIIGSVAGTICTLGITYLMPFLESKMSLHDTAGVHNLHGMGGMIGGMAGVVMAALASVDDYGDSLYEKYPARAPECNSTKLFQLQRSLSSIKAGENRTAWTQALYQVAFIGLTLTIAIVGGSLTGWLLRAPVFVKVPSDQYFDDAYFWDTLEGKEGSEVAGEDSTDDLTSPCDFESAGDQDKTSREEII